MYSYIYTNVLKFPYRTLYPICQTSMATIEITSTSVGKTRMDQISIKQVGQASVHICVYNKITIVKIFKQAHIHISNIYILCIDVDNSSKKLYYSLNKKETNKNILVGSCAHLVPLL